MSEPSALPPLTPWQEIGGGIAFFLVTLWTFIRKRTDWFPRVFGSERRGDVRQALESATGGLRKFVDERLAVALRPTNKRLEKVESDMVAALTRLTKVETETSYMRTDIHRVETGLERLEARVDSGRKEISGKIDNVRDLIVEHVVNGAGR